MPMVRPCLSREGLQLLCTEFVSEVSNCLPDIDLQYSGLGIPYVVQIIYMMFLPNSTNYHFSAPLLWLISTAVCAYCTM